MTWRPTSARSLGAGAATPTAGMSGVVTPGTTSRRVSGNSDAGAATPGRAVQVDPIKPPLKPTVTKRLKLEYESLLSSSAFKFNLRRYTPVP